MELTFGSLFSGIGGLDLGFERAGMHCAWQVEIDDYATKVLAKHWPNIARFRDVRSIGRHIGDISTCYVPLASVGCLIGGFPCQPHSQAGERKASEDERDLWPEFYRLIRELKPRWVVAENVLGLLSSEDGAFFGGVLRDLATAGYDARWQVLSAAEFGAPHLRERVIIVAHTSGTEWWPSTEEWRHVTNWTDTGWQEAASGFELCGETLANANSDGRGWTQRAGTGSVACESREDPEREGHSQWNAAQCSSKNELAYSSREGLSRSWFSCCIPQENQLRTSASPERGSGTRTLWATRATESGVGRAINGLSCWLDRYRWPARPGQNQETWEAPRVVTEKKTNRTARLKGLGNAVVPALAEYVGRCIMAAEMAERQGVA